MEDAEIYDEIRNATAPLEEKIDELKRVVLHLCCKVFFKDESLTLNQYLKGLDLERERILREREALAKANQALIRDEGRHPLQFRGDPKFMVDCEDAQSEYYYWERDEDSDDLL